MYQIDRFNKNKLVQNQIDQLFKEDMKLEHELLLAFRKDLLRVSDEEIIQKKVYIDKSRLSEEGYLEQLSKEQTEVVPA